MVQAFWNFICQGRIVGNLYKEVLLVEIMKIRWGLVILVIVIVGYAIIALNDTEVDEISPLENNQLDNSLNVQDKMEVSDFIKNETVMDEFKKDMDLMQNKTVEMEDQMPSQTQIVFIGDFQRAIHDVEGKALLIETPNGKILRFEDFETLNGPQLKIYLSVDKRASDFVDLGDIKATKGNINYEVPSDVDVSKYNHVLVWCKPFGVLFSYAELKSLSLPY